MIFPNKCVCKSLKWNWSLVDYILLFTLIMFLHIYFHSIITSLRIPFEYRCAKGNLSGTLLFIIVDYAVFFFISWSRMSLLGRECYLANFTCRLSPAILAQSTETVVTSLALNLVVEWCGLSDVRSKWHWGNRIRCRTAILSPVQRDPRFRSPLRRRQCIADARIRVGVPAEVFHDPTS